MPLTTGKAIIVYATAAGGTPESLAQSDVTSWVSDVVAAGGTVSAARQNIVRTMATSLYTDGLRSVTGSGHIIQYCIPFSVDPGSPPAAIFAPLWKPSGVTGTLVGTHNTSGYALTGYKFSGSNYLNTGFVPSAHLTVDSGHIALEIQEITYNSAYEIMGVANSNNTASMVYYYAPGNAGFRIFSSSPAEINATLTAADTNGFNLANRPSTSSLRWLNKNVLKASSSANTPGSVPGVPFYLGTENLVAGGTYGNCNERFGFLGLGRGMTTTQETAYYNAINTLRTAIAAS